MIPAILLSTMLMSIPVKLESDNWRSINDGVMGGRSAGAMVTAADGLKFRGDLSLENNGGFSSVRSLVRRDLSAMTHVRLDVRGDGREYQFRIRQSRRFDGVAWRSTFIAEDQWTVIDLPLDDFTPVFRGRIIRNAGPVVPADIEQIGFLLADGRPGDFELDIRRIEFFRQSQDLAP